jgi:hypothetical protein
MVVNYRELPVGPIVFFLLFVLGFLIALPLWALHHYGVPQHNPGKMIVAPFMGLFYVVMAVRAFRFNARVRVNPRALQWNSQGISLWQGNRAETVPWSRVSSVSCRLGKRRTDVSFLKIATARADGRVQQWSFSSKRLDLGGQSVGDLARLIEQARCPISRPVEKAAA